MNKTWQVEFIPEQNPIKVDFKEIIAHELEIASPDVLGGVRPQAKTEEMTQPVGIDAVGMLWTEEVDLSGYAQKSELPTKVSQLENDKGYLTEHQDISGKLDASMLPTAINTALAQAKASGEFDGKDGQDGRDGYTPQKNIDYFDGKNGESGKSAYEYAREAGYTGTEEEFAQRLASGGGSAEGAVLYTPQNLTDVQKAQARANIGVNESGSTDSAVLYTEQNLTKEQQTQARKNIGAVDIKKVEEIVDTALGVIENGTY